MILRLASAVALAAFLVYAQMDRGFTSAGASLLVLPEAGAPVTFEQIDERSRPLADGTTVVSLTRSRVYRDSAGRVRIESEIPTNAGQTIMVPYVDLIDPAGGFRAMLFPAEKAGYRLPIRASQKPGFVFFGFGERPGDPPRKWTVRTETLGKRMLEGIEFEGERVVRTAEGEEITSRIETWSSRQLNLMGLVIASGPHETHTTRLQNLQRSEPDPALFVIPSDYEIRELQKP